jgi:membrane protein required for colicin V production
MHPFDIVIYILAIILMILGIKRGLIDEVTRLSGIIAGFVCSLLFYHQIVPLFDPLHLPPQVSTACAFVAVFVAVFFIVLIIGMFIKKTVQLTMLGWVDRLCGGCLGLIKTFFVGWVAVIALSSIPLVNTSEIFSESKVFNLFHSISPTLQAEVAQRGKAALDEISNRAMLPQKLHDTAIQTQQPSTKDSTKHHVHHK